MKRAVTLKENYEFRRLYQKGASAVGGGMVLYCRKNRLGHNRLGVTVSVKLGHAVVRNRARRRLREVYRLNSGRLRQGYDMILVARGRTLTASWKELNDTFHVFAGSWSCWRTGHDEKGPAGPGEILPGGHLPVPAALLPVYSHLFPICAGGD